MAGRITMGLNLLEAAAGDMGFLVPLHSVPGGSGFSPAEPFSADITE